MNIMNIFGQKLRKLRENKGLTQQQLAGKLGYVQ
jgi:transcriptional regulator with XRE-family HTH domain